MYVFALGYAPGPGSHCSIQNLSPGKASELGGSGSSLCIPLWMLRQRLRPKKGSLRVGGCWGGGGVWGGVGWGG